MTPARVCELLRIGTCSPGRRCAEACATCDEAERACMLVMALAGVARQAQRLATCERGEGATAWEAPCKPHGARLEKALAELDALMRRGVL